MEASPVRSPSALIPIGMSMAALALVVGHAVVYRIVHQVDEGTPAHIFQPLMAAQLPVIAFFAVRWVPRAPRRALLVLCLQGAAAALALASVLFLT